MAFLKNYSNDVFVSYARDDDVPDEGQTAGWVSTLVKGIRRRLRKKLGDVEMWTDHQLRGNERLTPALQQKLSETGILVAVLSPAYRRSQWCQAELEFFLDRWAESDEELHSRVFLVEADWMSRDDRPLKLHELVAYEFWHENELTKTIRTVSVRESRIGDVDYWVTLDRLGQHLATELKDLIEPLGPPIPGGNITSVQPNPNDVPTVFLAEVTDDLDYRREEVAAALSQAKIRILPDVRTLYPRDPKEFESQVTEDLKNSNSVFIQLLSAVPGKKADGNRTYAQIQFDLAEKLGRPILQWRSPDCKVEEAPEEHRRLLRQAQAVSIQKFKDTVVRESHPAFEATRSSNGSGYAPVIRIATDDCDFDLARKVDRKLAGLHANPITSISDPKEEALKYVDGLLFVCGETDQANLELRVLKHRDKRHVKDPPLSWAVYQGPPPQQRPVLLTLDDLRRIDGRTHMNEEDLQKFVAEVRSQVEVSKDHSAESKSEAGHASGGVS